MLEERSQRQATEREAVTVDGIHEALEMVQAAKIEIDWARRMHMWEYSGEEADEQEMGRDEIYVEGLLTLKRRFNEFVAEERKYKKTGLIVREILEEHFRDKFEFDPIVVAPAVDEFGDGDGRTYYRILIVFNGDQDKLEPGWISGLIGLIRPRMIEESIEEFPSPSFVEKDEWANLNRRVPVAHP